MISVIAFVPAVLAVAALFGITAAAGRLGEATPAQRAGLWLLMILLGTAALGIGGCYAWVFFGHPRFAG